MTPEEISKIVTKSLSEALPGALAPIQAEVKVLRDEFAQAKKARDEEKVANHTADKSARIDAVITRLTDASKIVPAQVDAIKANLSEASEDQTIEVAIFDEAGKETAKKKVSRFEQIVESYEAAPAHKLFAVASHSDPARRPGEKAERSEDIKAEDRIVKEFQDGAKTVKVIDFESIDAASEAYIKEHPDEFKDLARFQQIEKAQIAVSRRRREEKSGKRDW